MRLILRPLNASNKKVEEVWPPQAFNCTYWNSLVKSKLHKNINPPFLGSPCMYDYKELLTSSEAEQYQQNTCLHRLHIIWAHPASLSMGTRHTGHLLMCSLQGSSGPWWVWPWVWPACQGSRQREQNSVTHVGHSTATGPALSC